MNRIQCEGSLTEDRIVRQLQRLEVNCGKSYSEPQIDAILGHLGQAAPDIVDRIIDKFIDYFKALPLPKHFKAAIQSLTRYSTESTSQYEDLPDCEQCAGSGTVWLSPRDSDEPIHHELIAVNCDRCPNDNLWELPKFKDCDMTGMKVVQNSSKYWCPEVKAIDGIIGLTKLMRDRFIESQKFWNNCEQSEGEIA